MQKLKIELLITIILTTKKKYNQYSTVDVNVGLYLVFPFQRERRQNNDIHYMVLHAIGYRRSFRGSIVFIGLKSCVRLVIKSFLFLLTSKLNKDHFCCKK